MKGCTAEELQQALRIIASTIKKCEKQQSKFAEGSPQHSLLKNRIKALRIAESLVSQNDINYSKAELAEASRPIASIISKCQKAQQKFDEETPNHARFSGIIKAMRISESFITAEIQKRE